MKLLLIALFLFPFALPASADNCSDKLPTVTFAGWHGNDAALEDGYFVYDDHHCWYVPQDIPLVEWLPETPAHYSTRAIWMADGVIEISATFNQLTMEGVEGFVALTDCSRVGSDIWVRPPQQEWARVRVADCAMPEHEYFHIVYVDSGIELSYELAQHWGVINHRNPDGGIGVYGFEVCLTALDLCNGTPVDYRQWYLDTVTQPRNR